MCNLGVPLSDLEPVFCSMGFKFRLSVLLIGACFLIIFFVTYYHSQIYCKFLEIISLNSHSSLSSTY